jgi:hypothetical protein
MQNHVVETVEPSPDDYLLFSRETKHVFRTQLHDEHDAFDKMNEWWKLPNEEKEATLARIMKSSRYTYANCPKNIPSFIDIDQTTYKRVFVVGDLHGDIDAAVVCLKHLAKIVDVKVDASGSETFVWTGGKNVVVIIMGDVIDGFREGFQYENGLHPPQSFCEEPFC